VGSRLNGLVSRRRTTRTMTAVVRCAHWLRSPAVSTMAVVVGLPMTTNTRLHPAARFAGHGQNGSVSRLLDHEQQLLREPAPSPCNPSMSFTLATERSTVTAGR